MTTVYDFPVVRHVRDGVELRLGIDPDTGEGVSLLWQPAAARHVEVARGRSEDDLDIEIGLSLLNDGEAPALLHLRVLDRAGALDRLSSRPMWRWGRLGWR